MTRRPRLGRGVAFVAAALALIAGGAYGLTELPGSSGSRALSSTGGSAQTVSWLGMDIETVAPGAAVVVTVKLGSAGDRAGLGPGDVIVAVNHRSINGAGGIGPAIRGLHSGDQVELQISHGSALRGTYATLAAPPSSHP